VVFTHFLLLAIGFWPLAGFLALNYYRLSQCNAVGFTFGR
jgi:hypothetical protein